MPLFYLEALGDVLIGEDGGDGGVPGGQQRLLCLLTFTALFHHMSILPPTVDVRKKYRLHSKATWFRVYKLCME
jgi:hypothetical protein